jgi:hypothetical protein
MPTALVQVDLSIYTPLGALQADTEAGGGVYRFDPTVCELPIERKDHAAGPFASVNNLEMTSLRRQALDQLISCCAEVLAYQHRTHLFCILLFPDSCRLLRWDPAGTIVTNLERDFAVLQEFLRRFNTATPAQRGLDPSVR